MSADTASGSGTDSSHDHTAAIARQKVIDARAYAEGCLRNDAREFASTGNPETAEMLSAVARFLHESAEAFENGYDLLCAECGCALDESTDMHDRRCSHFTEEAYR